MMKHSSILSFYFLFFILYVNQVFAAEKPLGPIDQFGRFKVTAQGKDVKPFSDSLEAVVSMVIGFLTIFAGLFFMINFIVGGIGWATAGGDSNKVEEAKKRMTNGALGLIIVVASYSIIYIISSVLGLDILNLSKTIVDNFN